MKRIQSIVPALLIAGLVNAGELDWGEIAEAGKRSLAKVDAGAARWTAVHDLPGIQVRILVDSLAGERRTVMSARQEGLPEEILRIYDVNGEWFVQEGGERRRFRPFEAPINFPNAYYFLCRSEAMFVMDGAAMAALRLESVENGTATCREPLPAETRAMMERMLSDLEQMKRDKPERFAESKLGERAAAVTDLLKNGLVTRIDTKSGLILETGVPGKSVRIEGFETPATLEKGVLDTSAVTWAAPPAPWTVGDLPDLAMFNHNAYWAPGQPAPDGDIRVVHLRTGELRRVPVRSGGTLPGCFLRHRNSVVVSALTESGGIGLVEVDLFTGSQRVVCPELMEGGISLGPVLSTDRRKLAAIYKGSSSAALEGIVVVIDLETGNAQRVGKSMDTYFLSWLPDNSGLVLLVREHSADMATKRVICRLDLDGTLTPIFEGDSPRLLADGKTMLYQGADSSWFLRSLDGGDPRPLPGNPGKVGFASPSPAGDRALFMRFEKEIGPRPVVIDLKTGEVSPVKVPKGLWIMPAWR